MGFAHPLRLVNWTIDGVVPTLEPGVVLRPHLVDDLDRFPEHAHPFGSLRETVAVGPPLMLVPAGADPGVEPAVAGHVDRGGNLGVEGRVAIAVAADHLPDVHPAGVACQRRSDRPA